MTISNPFRPTRFEHQDHPLIWLSPNVSLLEGLKSLYLAGTRGSGKTSLLKAVNWRERLFNKTLIDQLEGHEIIQYVAIYFRLPDYLSGAMDKVDWNKIYPNAPDPTLVEYDFFGKMIELISAQLVCEAFAELRTSGQFAYSPDEERNVVRSIEIDHPNLFGQKQESYSFFDLSNVLKRCHKTINLAVVRGNLELALELLPDTVPGTFLNNLCSRIRTLACGKDYNSCPPGFHIKICIDDCETLRPTQQKYINTLVRNSSAPVFWVISYVSSEYDTTSTVTPNQNLTDADRKQLDLNNEKDTDFRTLCEAVSLLRLYYTLPDQELKIPYNEIDRDYFNLDKFLGRRSINRMILDATRSSVSPAMAELVKRAREVQPKLETEIEPRETASPPIWQTYVIEKLNVNVDEYVRKNSRKALLAYLRRKQVAAFLNICTEYKLRNIPYAGSVTLISMSDLCVRDYLENLASVYDVGLDAGEIAGPEDLVERRKSLTLETQRRGLLESSRAKFEGIRNNLEQDWTDVMKVVDCLGHLCARLQSDNTNTNSLLTPERGIFLFNYKNIQGSNESEIADKRSKIANILHRCETNGLLRLDQSRVISDESPSFNFESDRSRVTTVAYRLHRRFAAYFGFSHRGPYETVVIPMEDFAALCGHADSINTFKWVDKVYDRINAPSGQSSLFGG